MIPLHLHISGFLSYRDPVELDFRTLKLACISGPNGAGKSSLLDSITWVLFGEARGKGADIINLHPNVMAAEVSLTFEYEGNVFRVQRTLPRNKSAVLEFQISDGRDWKPLTERTMRETQARIEQTLRLDHETFINASFFLQGKADQFTQKKASERKAVLGTILGLEVWDEYKGRAAEKRKSLEGDVLEIEGRLTEIETELAEEQARRIRLAEIETALKQLSATRAVQESILENIRKNASLVDEQRKLTTALSGSLERSRLAISSLEKRLSEKTGDLENYADLLGRTKEIESSYKAWQKARKELEEWGKTALEFREQEKRRSPLLELIASERARLEQEKRSLTVDEQTVSAQESAVGTLKSEIEKTRNMLEEAEAKIGERTNMEAERNAGRERQAVLKMENEALKADMHQLKERIDTLKSAEGATCPLCGQGLSREHRRSTLKQLEAEGREKGDRFRTNKSAAEDLLGEIARLGIEITKLANAEDERIRHSNTISQLTERIDTLQSLAKEWEKTGKKRLAEVNRELEQESYAAGARKQLAKLDKELSRLGYDTTAHDEKRREELELRAVEEDFHKLDKARDLKKQITSDIKILRDEMTGRQREIEEQENSYDKAAQALAASEALVPDIEEAEKKLFALREDENRTRDEAGAARQKVEVLATLRVRKSGFELRREEMNQQIVQYKTLERAFGKDGVPALLIEQALPQIEQKANELLGKLSNDRMSIKFNTLEKYKDEKRKDKKETLEITITDNAGPRDYEMYSGGEAFRVNFAIRLALSEILAQRKGARLQTLVIDEGFGSQDSLGRQRLIEAINLVKNDFEKILVITHLEELMDAFPNRIEVEKTERGSIVRII